MQNQTTSTKATGSAYLPSPAIQRLIEEVRNNEDLRAVGAMEVSGRYDRTHNRHNRGGR
jgi:hypothetical protein